MIMNKSLLLILMATHSFLGRVELCMVDPATGQMGPPALDSVNDDWKRYV